jgi:predicted lipoprotein with Yx(FWY)xxD motif
VFSPLLTKFRILLLFALVLFGAACGSDAATTAPATTGTPTSSSSAAKAAVSTASNASFGTILTDANGMTLYFFDKDKPVKPQSACTADCVVTWPLVLASEGTSVGAGLDQAKLGQITRPDGKVQLTYNSWPLYRYAGDTAPGQTNGQGIGGIWHVVGVDGKPITMAAAAAPASASTTPGY